MRLKGKGSEIFQNLMAMKTTRKYDDIKRKITSTLKRALQLVVLMLVVNLYPSNKK